MRLFVFLVFGIFLVGIFWLSFDEEISAISEKIERSAFQKEKLSNMVPGAWDIACPISETASPQMIAKEAGYNNLRFVEKGNYYRGLLLDGETGVVLIDIDNMEYSLFLVFYSNQISIIPTISTGKYKPCFGYDSAALVRSNVSNDGWLYITVEELGSADQ